MTVSVSVVLTCLDTSSIPEYGCVQLLCGKTLGGRNATPTMLSTYPLV